MIEYLTADDLFAQILLIRTVDDRTLMMVEGQSDDAALEPHVDEHYCAVMIGHSKTATRGVIGIADSEMVPRVFAVLDRDWDIELLPHTGSSNVIYTDHYDLDITLIFAGSVMRRLLSNVTQRVQVSEHIAAINATSAQNLLIKLTSAVGVLRYISIKYSHNLRLRAYPVGEALTTDCSGVDKEKLLHIAIRRSPHDTHSLVDLSYNYELELERGRDPVYYCNGHDLFAVFSHLARKKWGGPGGKEAIAVAMRSAVSCADLRSTQLFSAVHDWAELHYTHVWDCDAA